MAENVEVPPAGGGGAPDPERAGEVGGAKPAGALDKYVNPRIEEPKYFGELRHPVQVRAIQKLGDEAAKTLALYSKFERGFTPETMQNGAGKHQIKVRCQFNVIIAFEWTPGEFEKRLLWETFTKASDRLLEATDGYMAFHTVFYGGPELMGCADIQVFASNRLYPRSWVDGMHIDEKYQPIRIGRGYWQKNLGRSEAWNTPIGVSVIVHEWFHYAIGLKDDYVQLEPPLHVVGAAAGGMYALPSNSPVSRTLMANLDSPGIGKTDWKILRHNKRFEWLEISKKGHLAGEGGAKPAAPAPAAVGEPVPAAVGEPAPAAVGEPPAPAAAGEPAPAAAEGASETLQPDARLVWEQSGIGNKIDSSGCWIFLLKRGEGLDDSPELTLDGIEKCELIPQGLFEKPEGEKILPPAADLLETAPKLIPLLLPAGAQEVPTLERPGDGYPIYGITKASGPAWMILIGHAPENHTKQVVLLGRVEVVDEGEPKNRISVIGSWNDVMPTGPDSFPLVTVTNSDGRSRPPYSLEVHFEPEKPPAAELKDAMAEWKRRLFPMGETKPKGAASEGELDSAPSLDGHVLLYKQNGGNVSQLTIAGYSVGGSPGAGYPAGPNPVPAGSAEGNAMVFFYDHVARERSLAGKRGHGDHRPTSDLRIITTTNLHTNPAPLPTGEEPRGYVFSLTTNMPLPMNKRGRPKDHPTLVLYFDKNTKTDEATKQTLAWPLAIYRRTDDGAWERLPPQFQEEDGRRLLVAAQINLVTAPGLFASEPRAEHYRMFLVKPPAPEVKPAAPEVKPTAPEVKPAAPNAAPSLFAQFRAWLGL